MPAPWFVADRSSWQTDQIILDETESHHARVLRVAAGDAVTVTDGEGTVARCKVEGTAGGRVSAEILDRAVHDRPSPEVLVFQGAPKGRKADDVVERLAELGVAEVRVYEGMRSVVRWDEERSHKLAARWASLARGAAKQSRNPFVARTGGVLAWDELLARIGTGGPAAVLWEEASEPLRSALEPSAPRVALVVGPEGGLDASEATALADAGARLVSLGPRILRTENAPLVAAAAVLFHYGVIG